MSSLSESLASSSPQFLVVAVTLAAGILTAVYFLVIKKSKKQTLLPLDDFIAVPLIEKEVLSHDTRRFTFGLPDQQLTLGLPIGQHLTLRFTDAAGKVVQRSYTPVTDDSTPGLFSLVIKVYAPSPPKFPVGGVMSQHLDSLKLGETILIKGPKGHLNYHGRGRFGVKPLGQPHEERTCSNIAMMAGGTGITPMLQILHAIFRNPNDTKTRVKLLYANQTPNDILVREELETMVKEYPDRFSVWYTVDRVDAAASWKYDKGFISKTMIEQHCLFENGQKGQTQVFMCGPPPMIKFACLPALTELGFTEKDWVIF